MNTIEIAKKLISMNTVSNESTVEIADFISNYLEGCGFKIEHHNYELKGVKKVNVIARKGGKKSHLAFSGHMDTVPFDESKWNTNPLELTQMGDKYYGRGACDMKGFLAIAMKAGAKIKNSELKKPFALVFTSDEEVGCIGAKNLVKDKGKIADMFVIGEPTEFVPFILHKGYMFIRIELYGKRGHSSRPDEGINVVELALRTVLKRIDEFKKNLKVIHNNKLEPPFPTLNVGVVATGDTSAKNIITDYCRLELDIRPIPGQDVQELFLIFSKFITRNEEEMKGVKIKVSYGRAPTFPMETDKDSFIVKEVEKISGRRATSTSFNTEGGVFNGTGASSVIYGPGSIGQAHQTNEFIYAHYFSDENVQKFSNLIRTVCGHKSKHKKE